MRSCVPPSRGQSLRGRVVFLEAEALLGDTRAVLDQLGVFLGLHSPLQTEYRRFAHTGELGFGDPSTAITAGRISVAPRENRTAVSIPRHLASRLETAYYFWSAAIRHSCHSISVSAEAANEKTRC
jgi:hypothetical protein